MVSARGFRRQLRGAKPPNRGEHQLSYANQSKILLNTIKKTLTRFDTRHIRDVEE
jgi:hypothetical protein